MICCSRRCLRDLPDKLQSSPSLAQGILPVLVITAQPNEKLRVLNVGALDFLSKPFDIAEVLARVKNLLQVRLLTLETQKLYQQVLVEQDLSEMLLHNVLPHAIAERLKGRSKLTADHLNQAIVDSYANMTVLALASIQLRQLSLRSWSRMTANCR